MRARERKSNIMSLRDKRGVSRLALKRTKMELRKNLFQFVN